MRWALKRGGVRWPTPASNTTRSSRPTSAMLRRLDLRPEALYHLGLTGVPIVNVNNNCSTGSTALFLPRQAIASGAADCVLALGFEQMKPGALGSVYHRSSERVRGISTRSPIRWSMRPAFRLRSLFRRRGAGSHAEVRHQAGSLRQDPRQGEPSRQEQPVRDFPQEVSPRM